MLSKHCKAVFLRELRGERDESVPADVRAGGICYVLCCIVYTTDVQAGVCTAVQLTVPQHVNIETNPVFNRTLQQLVNNKKARWDQKYSYHIGVTIKHLSTY